MGQYLLTERLMAVEIIAQHGGAPRREAWAPALQPAGGGVALAILLGLPVLGLDELRRQREHRRLTRGDQRWGGRDVVILGLAVGQGAGRALRAMDRLGAVVLGAVERHQQAPIQDPMRRQLPGVLQGPDEVDEHRCQMRRRDRVEQVADLLGARNLVHAKQRTGVVAPALLLHPPLIIQERRTLQEEHREGAQRL